VAGSAGARGDNVLIWRCDGGRDQTWRWEPISDESISLAGDWILDKFENSFHFQQRETNSRCALAAQSGSRRPPATWAANWPS
jgi:hypothetical protein